jgi:hypothetical protein
MSFIRKAWSQPAPSAVLVGAKRVFMRILEF